MNTLKRLARSRVIRIGAGLICLVVAQGVLDVDPGWIGTVGMVIACLGGILIWHAGD